MSRYRKLDSVELHGWQQNVIEHIEKHEEDRESEQYQGISEYSVNRSLGMQLAYPRKSGHTFLVNYIAAKYPSVLIYGKMQNYMDCTQTFSIHPQTDTISTFEIYYALHKPTLHTPSQEYLDIRRRFEGRKVVVVDNGLSLHEDIKNFLFEVAQGAVILLGH